MTRLQRGMTGFFTVLLSLYSDAPIVAQTNPGQTAPKISTGHGQKLEVKRKSSTLHERSTLVGGRNSQNTEGFAIPIITIEPISPANAVSEAWIGPGQWYVNPELFPPEKPKTPPQSSPEDNP